MRYSTSLVVVALFLASAGAQAQAVTYEFTAELNTADSVSGMPNAGSINEFLVDNNITTLTGTYAYDLSTPLRNFSTVSGAYPTGVIAFDQFDDAPSGLGVVTVLNDAGLNSTDGFLDSQFYDAGQAVDLVLTDDDGTVFGGIGLPALLNFADFEFARIDFITFVGVDEFETETSELFFDLTEFTLIPEPASLALLGLGGLALIASRRRH